MTFSELNSIICSRQKRLVRSCANGMNGFYAWCLAPKTPYTLYTLNPKTLNPKPSCKAPMSPVDTTRCKVEECMSGVVDLKLRTGSGLLRCGMYIVYLEGQGDLARLTSQTITPGIPTISLLTRSA